MSLFTGLRETKKLGTRNALVDAALRLSAERGYDGFTIADLVNTVGVSRRTFSNYFSGKAECVAAASDRWMDASLELIDAAPPGVRITDLLRQVLHAVADHIAESGAEFVALAASEPEVAAAVSAMDVGRAARIAAVFSAHTGIPASDVRVPLLAEFALAAGRECTARWIASGQAGGRAALADDLDRAFSLLDLTRLSPVPAPH